VLFYLKEKVREACLVNNIDPRQREQAILWIFGFQDSNGPSFEDCCAVFGARHWVVQLMVQLQYWRLGIRFSAPMSFAPPPMNIIEEASYLKGSEGAWVLRRIWEWPGICTDELLRMGQNTNYRSQDIVAGLESLDEKGLVIEGNTGMTWYCVGRSPINQAGRPVRSWSALWREE